MTGNNTPTQRSAARRSVKLVLALSLSFTVVGAPLAQAQDSLEEARNEREKERAERAKELGELEAAKLDDRELSELLGYLTTEIAATELAVASLHDQLVIVEADLAAAAKIQTDAVVETERLKDEIAMIAVAGFVRSTHKEQSFFSSGSLSDAYRQDSLIREANAEPAELLDQIRLVEEEGKLAEAQVRAAAAETIELEALLADRLAGLEGDRATSVELKRELEVRVAEWEAKVSQRDNDIKELTAYIIANTPPSTTGPTVPPPPSDPSVQGYNWPLVGRLSSGFGTRVHPIFGTRRMHTGIDLGGRAGEPIYAAKGGVVLSAGWRGGYGNAVVIDHGGGFSTLYAHQSAIAVSAGQAVAIGDVVGYVGSTGWSTGPHLHFELRLNGNPIDPVPYLP
ncbi:MAG: peptidoglycan DD-metalloendopeptidase family protein [Acidimicrobiales bacterium]|nr:peptidoglycan DD-metalloendopeptidase family protein [Acidimicrobiales bacterium]